jgi:hypothetical protein
MIDSTCCSSVSVNFSPAPEKTFDAVVLERIVRRGDDHARRIAHTRREVRDRRRRDDSRARQRAALAANAESQLTLDPRSRLTRIPPGEEADLTASRVCMVLPQCTDEGAAEPSNRCDVERGLASFPAHAVSTE